MNIDNAVTAGLQALAAQSTNRPQVWDAMTLLRLLPKMVQGLRDAENLSARIEPMTPHAVVAANVTRDLRALLKVLES